MAGVEMRTDRVAAKRAAMLAEGWFPENGNPGILGRFVDHEWSEDRREFGARHGPRPAGDQPLSGCVMLETCAVNAEAVRRGVEETSGTKVKRGNLAELRERFPGAWEDYERRGGNGLSASAGLLPEASPIVRTPSPQVIGSAIEAAGYSDELVAQMKAKGLYSLENIAAIPDAKAFELLGPHAWDIRKAATEALARIAVPLAGTPLQGLSFLNELDVDRLATEMNVTNLERLAAMTDAECWQMQPNGEAWRNSARQILAVKRTRAEDETSPAPAKPSRRKAASR